MFKSSSENIKREIILSAYSLKADSWIRELKEDYNRFDSWNKRAIIIAYSILPNEERKYFYKAIKENSREIDIMDDILIKWAKNK